ncbi:MAG: mucoidy inhibitor MuiA family protein [Spirochaetia bacterium]|nr:mucoidy inhibitor MuiA family protein [Spirochaetia bacterium]
MIRSEAGLRFLRMPFAAGLAVFLSAASAFAQTETRKSVDSGVSKATIYSDRAMVTREAVVNLEPGANILVFEKIPFAIEAESLQLSGTGSGTLLDLRLKTETFSQIQNTNLRPLYERKSQLEDKLREISDTLKNLERERSLVESMKDKLILKTNAFDNAIVDTKKWTELLDFYRSRLSRIDGDVRDQGRAKTSTDADLAKINADIRDSGNVKRKEVKTVEARVDAAKKGEFRLRLSYIVPGPSWAPTYDLRLDAATKQIKVTYYAMVQQGTEESWENVDLTFSTAKPQLGGEAPSLTPWILSEAIPRPVRSRRMAVDDERMMKSAAAPSAGARGEGLDVLKNEEKEKAAELLTVKTTVETRQASVDFHVEKKSTVPNDRRPQKIYITETSYPSAFEYASVPRLSPYVYLKAQATNTSDYPLLAGRMNVFFDNTFVATTGLDFVASGENFSVSLGVDESISISHKLIKRNRDADGFLTGSVRWSYKYLITVRNNKKTSESVTISDRTPFPTHQSIKVKLLEPVIKPGASVKMDESGRLEYKLDLKPGEKIELPIVFTVEYPSNFNIEGLE